jgi:hypothetical protein
MPKKWGGEGGGKDLASAELGGGLGRLRYLSGNVGLAVIPCSLYLEVAVRAFVQVGEYPGGEGA